MGKKTIEAEGEGTIMDMKEKTRENRLRRMADRQGLTLRKHRRRDPRAIDFGTYYLVDAASNYIVAGERMDIDEVEHYLTQDPS